MRIKDCVPFDSWCSWGIYQYDGEPEPSRYFFLKLPIWKRKKRPDGSPYWMQLEVSYDKRLYTPHWQDGWSIRYVVVIE